MAEILTIQESLTRVMHDVGAVGKDGRNEQQKFSFRGIDAVVNAVSPALQKNHVVVVPHLDAIAYEPFATSAGKSMMCARVIVTYAFIGQGNDRIEVTVPGEAFDAGDKSTAKAMSVAFRTALLQALTLPTDDPDPDSQSYEDVAPASAAPGESTANANRAGSADAKSGQAAAVNAASPSPSAAPGGAADAEAPVGSSSPTTGIGEGATSGRATGASTNYLSADDQALLATQFGSKVNAVKAYKVKFPQVARLGDITYEMRDEIESAAV